MVTEGGVIGRRRGQVTFRLTISLRVYRADSNKVINSFVEAVIGFSGPTNISKAVSVIVFALCRFPKKR